MDDVSTVLTDAKKRIQGCGNVLILTCIVLVVWMTVYSAGWFVSQRQSVTLNKELQLSEGETLILPRDVEAQAGDEAYFLLDNRKGVLQPALEQDTKPAGWDKDRYFLLSKRTLLAGEWFIHEGNFVLEFYEAEGLKVSIEPSDGEKNSDHLTLTAIFFVFWLGGCQFLLST